jgi:RND superfamily putative drug exporter
MRRPVPVAAVATLVMLALAAPALRTEFTSVDASVLPEERSARVVAEALDTEFPPNRTAPTYLAVTAPEGPATVTRLAAYADAVQGVPGVAGVDAPQRVGPGTWRIDVTPHEGDLTGTSQQMVRDIRALDAPFPVQVGGGSAAFVDQSASLADRVPLAVAIVAVSTIALLFLMTGSVLLPIKAVVLNLLTVAAAFGVLVTIFQDGRLEGLLAYTSQGALEQTQPILLAVVAFGLSTDYGVFLLTRIKEARDAGADDREAVATGLERTGRIVTAAALLFCIAIGAFATSEIVFIKEVGIGTAAAVIIDATIVRAFLVPSLMRLLGRWNWWAPRPLRRLHDRFGLRESEPLAGGGAA